MATSDHINNPGHYTHHPKGIECIDVIEDIANYNLAAAIKYVWRCEHKGDKSTDLRKAIWHLTRELQRTEGIVTEAPKPVTAPKPANKRR